MNRRSLLHVAVALHLGCITGPALAETVSLAEIRRQALAYADALQVPGKPLGYYFAKKPDLHVVLGAVGTFGLLQQLLPETFVDDVRWTDIFSDPRLYQTLQVEKEAQQ